MLWETSTMILRNTWKMLIFFGKNMSCISPRRPYRTLKRRPSDSTSCLLPKKHGFHDERCSAGWESHKNSNCLKISLYICPESHPYTLQNPKNACKWRHTGYTTEKTRAPRRNMLWGHRRTKKSLKMKNLHFLTSRTTPLDPTGRQKHVRKMGKVVFFRKNTGWTMKDTLVKRRLKNLKAWERKT